MQRLRDGVSSAARPRRLKPALSILACASGNLVQQIVRGHAHNYERFNPTGHVFSGADDTNPDPKIVETTLTAETATVDIGNGVMAHAETIKISDFGLARAYEASSMSGLTVANQSGGKLTEPAAPMVKEPAAPASVAPAAERTGEQVVMMLVPPHPDPRAEGLRDLVLVLRHRRRDLERPRNVCRTILLRQREGLLRRQRK